MNHQLRQQSNLEWAETLDLSEDIWLDAAIKQRTKQSTTGNLRKPGSQHREAQRAQPRTPKRAQSWAEAFELSAHARQRAGQRGLRHADICYVLCHGKRTFAADATIYFLRAIDIPPADQATMGRLEGTAVLVSQIHNTIITVWRNRLHGTRNLNRKLDQHWYTAQSIK